MSAAPPSDDDTTAFDPTMAFPPRQGGVPPPPQPTLDTGNALPTGTYLGEFELLSVVGEGGFGIVYRAWDHSLKRQVAVKEYMPSSLAQRSGGLQVSVRSDKYAETFAAGLQSFVKEARMLAQFDHPALVKVFRFWEANGSAYMVMPFYEGNTLRDELRKRATPPDEATLLGWLGPIADALAIIHAEYWYHRDIAPDNVLLLAGSRRPVLLDFGAARRVIGDMTQALTVILKPGYAPVEQYAEIPGMKQGPWTDVYALAALAYTAVRGRTPPPSVGRLVNDSFEPLSQVAHGRYSEQVLTAIDRALAVRPEQRTQTIAAFKAELGLAPSPVDPGAGAGFAASQPVPLAEAPTVAAADLPTLALPREEALERTRVVAREARDETAPPAAAPSGASVAAASAATRVARPAPSPAVPSAGNGEPPTAVSSSRGWLVGAALLGVVGLGGVWWWSAGSAPEPAGAASTTGAMETTAAAPAPEPAPPATVPTPPAAVAGFDARLMFQRVVAASAADWSLQLTAPQASWRMDRDKLSFTLQSTQDGHVYVFNHGSDGSLQQLYPNALTPAPMAVKGQPLTLPQGALQFDVTGPPGQGELLVLVSRWPRDTTAFAPKLEGGFASFPTGSVALALEGANAGALPLLVGRPQCPAGTACVDAFGAATLAVEVTD
jgi:hypothetical protein